jgi:hypothetical protein
MTTSDPTSFSLFLTSDSIEDESDYTAFTQGSSDETLPPTMMKTKIRLPTLIQRATATTQYRVHIETLFLNAVWRDSEDPSVKLTANSGTSISDKIYVTFYVGDISQNLRLLGSTDKLPSGTSYDLVIHRTYSSVGELASFSYYTNKSAFDSNMFFENQFTNHTEMYGVPGLFLGMVHPNALTAIATVPYITVVMINNRTDQFISPFWYNKFLTGVSQYLPPLGRYDVVASGAVYQEFYKEIDTIVVNRIGGPYIPISLYTLAAPFHPDLYTGTGLIWDVSAPLDGAVNLLSYPSVEMVVQQVAFRNATNASILEAFALTLGTSATTSFLYAKSDALSYTVPACDPSLVSSASWYTHTPSRTGVLNTALLGYPNGAYRGATLRTAPTALRGVSSPFPWEQGLTTEMMEMIEHKRPARRSAALEMHVDNVLRVGEYIYTPSGNWDDASGFRVGERSFQFDLRKERYVNKLQLIFPKSQERWQPTAINATIQQSFTNKLVTSVQAQFPAYWHQGYQHKTPYGRNDNGVFRHLHTLTQQQLSLGSTGATQLGTFAPNLRSNQSASSQSTAPISYTNTPFICVPPVYSDEATGEVHYPTWFEGTPNDSNPAHDAKRYEFGPFLQSPTVDWMRQMNTFAVSDTLLEQYKVRVARSRDPSLVDTFSSLSSFVETESAEKILSGSLIVNSDTAYQFLMRHPPYGDTTGYVFRGSSGSTGVESAFDYDKSTFWQSTNFSSSTRLATTATTMNIIPLVSDYSSINQRAVWVPPYSPVVGDVRAEWIEIELPYPARYRGYSFSPVKGSLDSTLPQATLETSNPASVAYWISDTQFYWRTPIAYRAQGVDTYVGDGTNYSSFLSNGSPYNGEYVIVKFATATRVRGVTANYTSNANSWRGWKMAGSNDNGATWSVFPYIYNGKPTFTKWNWDAHSYRWYALQTNWTSAEFAIIQNPDHILRIVDVQSGLEITAFMPQKMYTTADEMAIALTQVLSDETVKALGTILFNVTISGGTNYGSSTWRFTIASILTSRTFIIKQTSFATKLGFASNQFGVASVSVTTTSAHTFVSTSTAATARVSMIVNMTISTVQGNPRKWQLCGSNDRSKWTALDGYLLDESSAISMRTDSTWDELVTGTFTAIFNPAKNFTYVMGAEYDIPLAMVDQHQHSDVKYIAPAYKYYRLIFPECRTTSAPYVNISEFMLYSLDYESPLYRQVINVDYTSLEDRDDKYPTIWAWLADKFVLVQLGPDGPLIDYIVKEELHFAPSFDQNDSTSYFTEPTGTFEIFRPLYSDTPQKLVKSIFAQGRYAGIAPAFMSTNRGYTNQYVGIRDTRGDYDHKIFSLRLCHQLFSYVSTGGSISNKVSTDDAEADPPATFVKRVELGMLNAVALTNRGARYTNATLTTSQVSTGSETETLLTSTGNDAIAEAAMTILNTRNDTSTSVTDTEGVVMTRLPPPYTDFSDPLPTGSRFTITTRESDEASFTDTASTKTPLLRAANFKLNFLQAPTTPAAPRR